MTSIVTANFDRNNVTPIRRERTQISVRPVEFAGGGLDGLDLAEDEHFAAQPGGCQGEYAHAKPGPKPVHFGIDQDDKSEGHSQKNNSDQTNPKTRKSVH